jgi:uncharacterized cupin superfamily protein
MSAWSAAASRPFGSCKIFSIRLFTSVTKEGSTRMTALTPDRFVKEENPAEGSVEANLALWISEAGGLTQFGAFVEVLQPGTRSSIKHWHSAEDELVYVLEGQVTLVENDTETILKPGDAATFRAGVAVGHFLWNRSAAPSRCLVVGTRAPIDRITYPDHDRVCHRDRSLPDDIWLNTAGDPATSPY